MPVEFWKSFFDWGTVALIGLTFVFGAGALITGSVLNSRQDAKLREFDDNLTKAKAQVEVLRGDNLRLETKALSLQKELLAQGPREKLLTNEETRQELVDALKPFAGQAIDVRYVAIVTSSPAATQSAADERNGLAKVLISILKDAGWQRPGVPLACHIATGRGLSVHTLPNASSATRKAARALTKALKDVPLAVNGPDSISVDLAKRAEAEMATLPLLSEDTVILAVHPK